VIEDFSGRCFGGINDVRLATTIATTCRPRIEIALVEPLPRFGSTSILETISISL
jgi:hypothetical protein